MKKGIFIVVEGIDGNGKTTQARLLANYFRKKGRKVMLTKEPSRNKYGKKLSSLLRSAAGKKLTKKEWLELFTLDRLEHVKKVIQELKKGKIVICSRYYYSTLAYQLPKSRWKSYARQFLKPDLTFVFDLQAKAAMARIMKRMKRTGLKLAVFEREKLLEKVRKAYKQQAKLFDEIKLVKVNTKSSQDVFREVKKEASRLL